MSVYSSVYIIVIDYTYTNLCNVVVKNLEYNTFAPVDPWVILFVRWMNQGIVGLVLFDEIFYGLDGSRRLPSFHVGLVGQVFDL